MDQMRITHDTEGQWEVLTAVGDVDVASASELATALDAAIASSTKIVLDLSSVEFLDSTGLGVLVHAHNRCKTQGGQLRLVASNPGVMLIFEVTALDEVFSIFPTLEAARAASD